MCKYFWNMDIVTVPLKSLNLTLQSATDLSETERQKTPSSLYHIQQKQISFASYMVHTFEFSFFSIVFGHQLSNSGGIFSW